MCEFHYRAGEGISIPLSEASASGKSGIRISQISAANSTHLEIGTVHKSFKLHSYSLEK